MKESVPKDEKYYVRQYIDRYLAFGRCDENAHAAARLYAERFPQRRHPLPNVFRRLDEGVNFVSNEFVDCERSRPVRTAAMENAVLARIGEAPSRSTNSIAEEFVVNRRSKSTGLPFVDWVGVSFCPKPHTSLESLKQPLVKKWDAFSQEKVRTAIEA
ncbi:hypothetical protein ILUMI_07052 [Ignelater luminosus]|uniref:DUF4817 domain-containing protein n=1 Tax=Ignelater luminosus TaxID=2038154 RepID=A0A8K0DEA4_IGNLU|nr:hypothetical protein ILUMI_07052 [Ignelater luminosus]